MPSKKKPAEEVQMTGVAQGRRLTVVVPERRIIDMVQESLLHTDPSTAYTLAAGGWHGVRVESCRDHLCGLALVPHREHEVTVTFER